MNCPGDDLATAISSASAGDTLVIGGTCTGSFLINKKLTLLGATGATLDGGGIGLLSVLTGKVKLKDLTIKGGVAPFPLPDGGGIRNTATLTLTNVVVQGNTAGIGGGISNNGGLVTLSHSVVTGNSSTVAGGSGRACSATAR